MDKQGSGPLQHQADYAGSTGAWWLQQDRQMTVLNTAMEGKPP